MIDIYIRQLDQGDKKLYVPVDTFSIIHVLCNQNIVKSMLQFELTSKVGKRDLKHFDVHNYVTQQ